MEKLKPCPWCGKAVEITTSEENFNAILRINGASCVSLRCWDCHVEMYDHSPDKNYAVRLEKLVKKWNGGRKNG